MPPDKIEAASRDETASDVQRCMSSHLFTAGQWAPP